MIKTILITGLDGSGKSTLFSKLEEAQLPHVQLISALHVAIDTLPDTSILKEPVALLNAMHQEADATDSSDLKAIALFCAMVLFEKLVSERTTESTRIILCERHPLIDTFAYAQFYIPRLSSGNTNFEQLFYFATKYESLFAFILEQLPIENKEAGVLAIYKFIKSFFVSKTSPDAETEAVFKTSVPDHIFFLKAPPEVLMERISTRKVIEAHEKLSVLSDLSATYDTLFKEIETNYTTTTIEKVDASTFTSLDTFYTRLLTDII